LTHVELRVTTLQLDLWPRLKVYLKS